MVLPPPSPELLKSLTKTPQDSIEVEELRRWLYLMWDSNRKLEARIAALEP